MKIKKFLKIDIFITLILLIFAIAMAVAGEADIANFMNNVENVSTYFDREMMTRFLAACFVFVVLYVAWLVYESKTKKLKVKLFKTIFVTLVSLFINTILLSGFIIGCVILEYFSHPLEVFDLVLTNLVVFFLALTIVLMEVLKSKMKLENMHKSLLLPKVFVFVPILFLFVAMMTFAPSPMLPLFLKFLIGIVIGFYCGIVVPIRIFNF